MYPLLFIHVYSWMSQTKKLGKELMDRSRKGHLLSGVQSVNRGTSKGTLSMFCR